MLRALSTTKRSRRSTKSAPIYSGDQLISRQLIKQLSATPTILPQNASNTTTDFPDPQAALQANKATFFFRLVRSFYSFQQNHKAEIYNRNESSRKSMLSTSTKRPRCGHYRIYQLTCSHTAAQTPSQNTTRQEESDAGEKHASLQNISKLRHPARRIPTIRQ